MANIWNQYQCMVTFNMSRSASYYESGTGRGMGFRDSCQDLLGFVHLIPERARERILDIAATQFEDGSAYHQYQPLTKKGNLDIGSGFNDDPLWLIAAVSAYLKETGDFSILNEMVDFDNQKEKAAPLYEHLRRSFEYTATHLGPHKLPLIGRADWNDCLNLNCFSTEPGESFQTTGPSEGPVAESVFIAGMFVKYGREFAEISRHMGDTTAANRAEKEVNAMYQAVLDAGWDGEWFVRAYDAESKKSWFQRMQGRSDLYRTAGLLRYGKNRCERRSCPKGSGFCQRASGYQIRYYDPSAGLYPVLSEPWRNFLLSAGIQRECWYLLATTTHGSPSLRPLSPRKPRI